MYRPLNQNRVRNLANVFLAGAVLAALAACGGGGGGGGSTGGLPPVQSTPTPTTSPTTAPPTTASVSGTVVNYASNTPLSGVPIAIAPWTVGATPIPEATTNASGQFSFTATTGQYLLIVGSNSATATTATLHQKITLVAGNNVLSGATPAPEPDVTPVASQTAGALRLMTLSGMQQDCITGANSGRTGSLPKLVADEYLEEDAIGVNIEEAAQKTDTPTPLFGFTQALGGVSGLSTEGTYTPGSQLANCSGWTGSYSYTNGNPPYAFATNATNIWFGGDIDQTYTNFGVQMWNQDPR